MSISTTHYPENGDRLSRDDFELLCDTWSIENAELIHGVVRMNAAAVRFREHGKPHSMIMLWLGTYATHCSEVEVGDNTSIRFDDQNEPQPDAVMFRMNSGKCQVSADGYLEGTPELIVEIAASSVSYDVHEKLDLYEQQGIPEYIVWRTEDRAIDWFRLTDGRYRPLPPDDHDVVSSIVFPGLRLSPASMLNGDMKSVLNLLQNSRSSDE